MSRGDDGERPPEGLGRTAGRGASATLAGQLIRILVQLTGIIVLGRLLAPSDYGLIAAVTAIIGVGEVFRDFGLSSASIQAKTLTREHRDNLFWMNSGIGLVLSALAVAASGPIAAFYGDDRLQPLTMLLASTFLLNGLMTQFRADLNRNFRFLTLASTEIAAQVAGLTIGVVMASNGYGYWSLAGQQVSQAVVALVLLVVVTGWFPRWYHRRVRMGSFLAFGGNLTGAMLLGYASRNTDSVVIGASLGAGPLGLYNRAFQLLLLPLNQINAPSTRVALPVLSRLQDSPARYADFIVLGQTIMLHVVTLAIALACAQASPLILLSIGEQWSASAPIFQVLSVGGFFQAAAYATYWAFLSKGAMRQHLYFSLATRPLLIVLVVCGGLFGVYGVAAAYSIGVALIWPIGLWWVGRVTDVPARRMFLTGARAVAGYGAATVASWAGTLWVPDSLPLVSIAVGLVILLVAVALVALVWPAFRRDVIAIAQSRRFLRAARGRGADSQDPPEEPGSETTGDRE